MSSDTLHTNHRPVVYADGSCSNNGTHTAAGGVGVFWGSGNQYNVSEKLCGPQTNQRAEVVAACRALETAIEQNHKEVELRTDSSYTIKAMTEWIGNWSKNGWKTYGGGDVKNKEDFIRLNNLCERVKVNWVHVPAHKGVPGNEAADTLAKTGSLKY
jgi:ribonuclease HI